MNSTKIKIVIFTTEDWFFLSHRLNLGMACLQDGWEVIVATRVHAHGKKITDKGFHLAPLRLRRGGMNPFHEFCSFLDIFRVFAKEKPDIVHFVGLKLILYGSVLSFLFRKPIAINAVSGLGTLFTNNEKKASFVRRCIIFALPFLLKRKGHRVIVQNHDDYAFFQRLTSPENIVLIPGSGVDIDRYSFTPEPDGTIVAAVVSRMLGEKGIYETVEAARILKERRVDIRIILVGSSDPENPSSISEDTLHAWNESGIIEWVGHRDDIVQVWANAHIAVLPSYREGFPKSLIEAMASGRPAITTDAVGCREVIEDGISGILVPLFDAVTLADALQKLAEDAALRRQMGAAARIRTEALFSDKSIAAQTMRLYRSALASKLKG